MKGDTVVGAPPAGAGAPDVAPRGRSQPGPAATAAPLRPADPPGAPIRVGMVTHYMPPHLGGIELLAEGLGRAYAAAGLDVRWVASRVPGTAPRREPGRIRVACWNGLERRLGVPWPVWTPGGAREVARLCQWADVLHVHDCLYLGSLLAVTLGRRARTPVVLSQHIGFVPYRRRALRTIEHLAYRTIGRATLRGATRVVFCTPSAQEFVTGLLGGAPATATDIPYGIDTARFRIPVADERTEARRRLGLSESGPVVLFVGRLVEKKGADLFLEVSRRNPHLHFLMVGSGPLEPVGPRRQAHVRWIPALPPAEMPRAYQAADVLLLPSHGEGFPFAILEAMASGVPVVTSRGEAFTRRLEREGAALPAERTVGALDTALAELLGTRGRALTIALRARELVVREWSHEVMERRYLELLRALAAGD